VQQAKLGHLSLAASVVDSQSITRDISIPISCLPCLLRGRFLPHPFVHFPTIPDSFLSLFVLSSFLEVEFTITIINLSSIPLSFSPFSSFEDENSRLKFQTTRMREKTSEFASG